MSNVCVKRSRIKGAGNGLFATSDIPKGECVAKFRFKNGVSGAEVEALTPTAFLRRYKNVSPTYVFYERTHSTYWDATKGGLAATINSNSGGQNARFDGAGNVIATQKIHKGQEIYVSYGRAYWKGRPRPATA